MSLLPQTRFLHYLFLNLRAIVLRAFSYTGYGDSDFDRDLACAGFFRVTAERLFLSLKNEIRQVIVNQPVLDFIVSGFAVRDSAIAINLFAFK
jgi:hypothetical protein